MTLHSYSNRVYAAAVRLSTLTQGYRVGRSDGNALMAELASIEAQGRDFASAVARRMLHSL